MQNYKCHISVVSVQIEGDKERIANRLDVGIRSDIKSLDDFKKEIENVKEQYSKRYHDGGTLIVVRPQTLQHLVQMETWMRKNTESDKRHICTRVFVHSKNDDSFVWPVFMKGLDIEDERNRERMLSICKDISVSRVDGNRHTCYAEISDIHVFRSTNDENWISDTVLLCKKEEEFGFDEKTYHLFLDFDQDTKWAAYQ